VASYGEWSQPQERIAERLMQLLPGEIPPQRILDIGCGTGLLTGKLQEAYPKAALHGIDLAQGMVAACKEKWVDSTNLSFTVADAESDPIGDNYNLIASTCAFQWLIEPRATIKHLYDLLASDGWLVVGVPVQGSFAELAESYRSALGSELPGLELHAPQVYLKNLADAGFTINNSEIEALVQYYQDGWEMLRSFKGLGATFHNYPGYSPRSRREIRRLIKHYEANYRDSSQGVPVTYRVLYFLAEKAG
ncbi:MAG: methyltransferase domain-containing protein, partial [Planctomycetes bacterium]|nr:methyltransferase domain-containing protein [Planctomycetota bacterium]